MKNERQISGFTVEGIKTVVQTLNRLLLDKHTVFSNPRGDLFLTDDFKLIFVDLLRFLGGQYEHFLTLNTSESHWRTTFSDLNKNLNFKCKNYWDIEDFEIQLHPVLS